MAIPTKTRHMDHRQSRAVGSRTLAALGIDNSLQGTLNWARKVGKTDAPLSEKSQAALSVCQKAFEERRFLIVIEWAMRAFNLRASDTDLVRATRELFMVAGIVSDGEIGGTKVELTDAEKQLIIEQMRVFVQRDLARALPNIPEDCKRQALSIIRRLFIVNYLPLQLQLLEQLFNETTDPELKNGVAELYLSAVRLAEQNLTDFRLDREKLETMAAYVIDCLPARVGHSDFVEQGFSSIVTNLGGFGLWDLFDRAIAIHPPAADAPLSIYLRLIDRLRHEGPAAAYEVVAEIPDLAAMTDTPVAHELGVQKVRLFRFYIDAHRVPLSEAEGFLQNLTQTGWHRRVLDLPRRSLAAISKQIIATTASLLTAYVRGLSKRVVRDHEVSNASFQIDTAANREYFFVWPEAEEIEFSIADRDTSDERYVKGCFAIVDRHKPRALTITDSFRFDGVSPAEQADLPLAWDILFFDRLVSIFPLSQGLQKEVVEIARKIDEAARRLFSETNQANYTLLANKIFVDDKFFDERDELYHRLSVCRNLLSFCSQLEKTGTYKLSPRDFLFPLVREVELIPARQFRGHFELQGENGLVGVKFTTGDGEFWGVVKSAKKIEIIGAIGKEVAIANEHLLGLSLEALVIAQAQEQGLATEIGRGMVVDLSGGPMNDSDAGNGLGQLVSIYSQTFQARMRARGLVSVPWFLREGAGDDLLYKPLADLSDQGKKAALRSHGEKYIFIPEVPTGRAVRLRVGPKGRGEAKKLDAYEPSRRNLDQQRFLLESVIRQQGREAVDLDVTPKLYYRLYVVTHFAGTDRFHLYIVKQSDNENDVLEDGLIGRVDEDIANGVYRQKAHLFRKTRTDQTNLLANAPIASQSWEIFPQHRTYERPPFHSLEKLLTDGFPLGFQV
ncbi:MAG: hypothetical protein ABIE84_03385 [bacterium]